MNTKRILHTCSASLLVIGAMLLTLVGCMDDDLAKNNGDVVEGVPITVNLKFSGAPAADVVVDTRADNSRSWLYNLTIYIYGSDGKWQQTVSTTDGTLTLHTETRKVVDSGVTYGVTFNTTSGEKKLLAIGNRGGGFWKTSSSIDVHTMSFDELEKYLLALSVQYNSNDEISTPVQIVSSDQMLITGKNEGIIFDAGGNVTVWGESTDGIAVKMERSMARITFNIAANPADAYGTFTPTSYKVYNVPVGSYLTNVDSSLTPVQEEGVREYVTFKNFASTPISPASGEAGNEQFSFSFYMPENICMTKDLDSYRDRDKWENGQQDFHTLPNEKKWTNAPQTSTFVVISGTYSGNATVNDNSAPVTGNVDYTIHLGDFSDFDSNGNFSVERNVSYTYNVTVKGVDNIIVEATTDESEEQPGAEGDIYDNKTTVYNYNLDAHYEQVYLEYNLSEIATAVRNSLGDKPSEDDVNNAIAQHLILSIQTDAMGGRVSLQPYKLATVDNETKEVAMKGVDYKWVEFYPQTLADELTPYPGTPKWSQSYIDGTTNPPTENETKVASMMDVYEVIVAMGRAIYDIYKGNQFGDYGIEISGDGQTNDYTARFTAFVNEYYYYNDPLTSEALSSWSEVTNKNPREMIIAMNSENSSDGNSSYNQIHSYISQLSMETIYNEGWNAFGIETYNETPLTFIFSDRKDKTSNLDDSDGRANQIRLLGNSPSETGTYGSWDTYLNIETNGWFGSVGTDHVTHKLDGTNGRGDAYADNYKYAYSACLSRNRDLNGNSKIDDNEVRWYLASINEYIRMGIGTRAISNAAQLFIGNKDMMAPEKTVNGIKTGYPHDYINSGSLFYTSSDQSKRVYWAVERGSYGTINYGGDKALPIRCVRVLPKDDMKEVYGVKADPTFEVTQYDVNGYPKVLKFKGRLVDGLYRERTDGVLDSHNEDQPMNAYSEGIIISSNAEYGNMNSSIHSLYNIYNYGDDAKNPCKNYHEEGDSGATWRVPNLSELSAMNAAKGQNDIGLFDWLHDYYYPICASCTHFRNMNVRSGFGRNVNYVYAIDQYGDDLLGERYANVRCVRDVPAGYFGN